MPSASARTVAGQYQFDFWLGSWELTWGDSGRGTNEVSVILDSMVILENFDGQPSIRLQGRSVSSYNVPKSQWQQTWVDNQGDYLDFDGGFEDGRMILARDAVNPQGEPIRQRMVWHNIGAESFDWNWEASLDGGKTWQVNWQIHYQRSREGGEPGQDGYGISQ